ncbi:MAG: 23S rRNA (adenine(2503)-C(2))-methyltransferase RlmN [bacterium]
MKNLFNYTKKDLENYFVSIGEKSFKATQVTEWVYRKRVFDVDGFLNMNKVLREKISNDFVFDFITVKKVEEDSEVAKFLFALKDGECIEAVLMKHSYGLSVCVSSQVGCNMGCAFCESGRLKKVRNLEVFEMVQQILLIEKHIEKKINSIVIMGIGEPFDNYDNILKFLEICNEPKGLEIGARHISVSTCGLVPKILEFKDFPLQINLAVSLHAPNDELRSSLMPVNKVYNLNMLIDALKTYLETTNRRVTIEYVLLKNVNDSMKNAHELARLLKGINVYVNLIYYNQTSSDFVSSDEEVARKFCEVLKLNNIDVTIRRKFGNKITAACGQLRSKEVE